MHLYLTYAREQWMVEGENAPVGLILCADSAVAHYALEACPTRCWVPHRAAEGADPCVAEIERTIHALETRRAGV
jgi:hypothetical protein